MEEYLGATGGIPGSSVNRRLAKLYKTVKATNPPHVYPQSLGPGTTSFSTSGGLIDLVSGIIQGDAYNQRFGNKIIPKRVLLKATVKPGTASTDNVTCRLTFVRAVSNLAAAATTASCLSPIADTNILQIYWDRYFTIGPAASTFNQPQNFNLSIPIKLGHIKFNGSGAGATVAESIFMIYSATSTTGTSSPVWGAGIVEFYFIP